MTNLARLATNPDAEIQGVWIPWVMDIELCIARIGNPKFDAFMSDLVEPFVVIPGQAPNLSEEMKEKFVREATANCVLLDWRNVTNEDGSIRPYTPEEGIKLFEDPAYRDMYKFVVSQANSFSNYAAQKAEVAVKN